MSKKMENTSGGHISPFERIKRTNDAKVEYWSSRDFAEVLGYGDYRNFEGVIEKAKLSCFNSGNRIEDHFVDVTEMIEIGKGGQRPVKTVLLSRYACYLVIQNADPKKKIVAQGQTYFAIQTRRQELGDERIEEERRLLLREEMRRHNVQLADAAKGAGVVEPIDYAIFQNHGYMGLYGGLKMEDIHRRKRLKKSQKILDHMGSTELAANLFRATQAEENITGCLRSFGLGCSMILVSRSTFESSGTSGGRHMAMTMQQLEAELFRLDIQSRAKLAEKLILSIDAPNEEENLQLWVAEAEHRLADLRAGKAREIPAEEAFRSIRSTIS